MSSPTLETVQKVFADKLGLDPAAVLPTADIARDLGAD